MKQKWILAATLAAGMFVASVSNSHAQVKIPMTGDAGTDLKTIERQFTAALIFGDVKTLTDLLDDNYLDTDEEGRQIDKKTLLAAVKSGERKMTAISLSQLRIVSLSTAAVVTGRAAQAGTVNGQEVPSNVSFTDTLAMVNGTWKFVATHRSAPKPAK